ncbi:uncharacterized protein LOC122023536 [Zingiber officinale]|uniref:uncharacterized protein LOC122023536 n=1 Tax=Zingiber officinale TaxID=94328 RepID=UPI001C4D6BA5|nr:uncharacterized protein LOC122023536 [Zingiber officinale]XP_042437621.1 uncharacterized protein LOC122023536 [Zingiber officinale]
MPPKRIMQRCGPEGCQEEDQDRDRGEREMRDPPPPPDVATRVLEGMAQLLEQHVGNANRGQQQDVYMQFRRMDPKDFSGTTDPFVAEGWIRSLEVIFRYMNMADADRVRCAIYLLKDDASLWWEGAERGVNLNTLTWEGFKRIFYGKYFTVDVRSRLKREFMSLRQGDMSVAEFVKKYDRGCHFVPLIAEDADEKMRHFLDGLRPTIRQDVLLTNPTDYNDAVTRAYRAEQSLKDIAWEMQKKRPPPPQQQQQNKKSYTGPQKGQPGSQGQPKPQQKAAAPNAEGKPLCKECNRQHYGKCMWGTYKCFVCGEDGHKAKDCPKKQQPVTGRAYVMHAKEAEPDTTLITGENGIDDIGDFDA